MDYGYPCPIIRVLEYHIRVNRSNTREDNQDVFRMGHWLDSTEDSILIDKKVPWKTDSGLQVVCPFPESFNVTR